MCVGITCDDKPKKNQKENCEIALKLAKIFLKSSLLLELDVKIAISCGDVHTGFLSVEKPQFIIIGNEVNLVSRICACDRTPRNTIAVTDNVFGSLDENQREGTVWQRLENLEVNQNMNLVF